MLKKKERGISAIKKKGEAQRKRIEKKRKKLQEWQEQRENTEKKMGGEKRDGSHKGSNVKNMKK